MIEDKGLLKSILNGSKVFVALMRFPSGGRWNCNLLVHRTGDSFNIIDREWEILWTTKAGETRFHAVLTSYRACKMHNKSYEISHRWSDFPGRISKWYRNGRAKVLVSTDFFHFLFLFSDACHIWILRSIDWCSEWSDDWADNRTTWGQTRR